MFTLIVDCVTKAMLPLPSVYTHSQGNATTAQCLHSRVEAMLPLPSVYTHSRGNATTALCLHSQSRQCHHCPVFILIIDCVTDAMLPLPCVHTQLVVECRQSYHALCSHSQLVVKCRVSYHCLVFTLTVGSGMQVKLPLPCVHTHRW